MVGVCAWCGRGLQAGPSAGPPGVTHGICQECYLDLRMRETLRHLESGAGPHVLFMPPNRNDLVLRLQREAPPGCSFVVHADRRRRDRRAHQAPAPADRRAGPDRRRPTLSFLASPVPGAPPRP